MKKFFLPVLALSVVTVSHAAIVLNQTIAIDFGTASTADNAFTIVNTTDTSTTSFSDHTQNAGVLRDTVGTDVSGVGFSITNMTGDNAGEAAAAAATQWISNDSTGTGSLTDGDTVIDGTGDRAYALISFSGLDDSLTYNFTASHNNATNFSALWQEVANVSNTQGPDASAIGFNGLSTDGSGNISFYMIRRSDVDGQHVSVSDLSLIAVPEPSSIALLGIGMTGLLLRRRRS